MSDQPSLTPTQKRILRFFYEQPHAVETVRGLATWLSVESQVAQEALNGLVIRKWLLTHQTVAVIGYALTDDDQLLIQIEEAMEKP